MALSVEIELSVQGIALGWVVAEGCSAGASQGGLLTEVRAAVDGAVAGAADPQKQLHKSAVRDMLRFGAYKPTGRGKPASEYLLGAALAGEFPGVNALVEINNLISVSELLPISLVDLDLAETRSFVCRRGREGESYAFNPSGQILDLRDLLLLARLPSDAPCATPVKDSQATKTRPGTRAVLGVVYAPALLAREAEAAAVRMGALMARFCGAEIASGSAPPRGAC